MAQFLNQKHVRCLILKAFLSENADRIKDHAQTMAARLGRPFQYLTAPTRKEDLARKMAEADFHRQAAAGNTREGIRARCSALRRKSSHDSPALAV
jgi:hypothetical protein